MKLGKRFKYILPYLFFFLLAFSFRIYELGFDVINIDASAWKERTYNFIGLFFARRFGDMAVTYHPGVTLMWMGGLAMKVFRGIYYFINGVTAPDTRLVYLWTHFAQKLPIVLITSLFVVFFYWAVSKLLSKQVALIAAFVLALEPFFIAHSRVFHLDALLTSFMVSSALSLLLYLNQSPTSTKVGPVIGLDLGQGWTLLAAGVFAGLALLTKSTALFLIPYAVLVLLLSFIQNLLFRNSGSGLRVTECGAFFAQKIVLPFLIWFAVVAVIFVILWPAMWTQPLQSLKLYFSNLAIEAQATEIGFYASSRHVIFGETTYSPAWYYYPLVLALRLTPVTLLFGILGIGWAVSKFWKVLRRGSGRHNLNLLYFFLYSLLFIVMLSIPAKKLDRYILPVIPIVCVFAGYGISQLLNRLKVQRFLPHLLVSLFAVRLITFIPLHPDYGFYFSPLFGGAQMGMRFDADYWWGEGYKKGADYLNSKESAQELTVGVFDDRSFKPFFQGTTHDLGADYDVPEDYWIRSANRNYEGYGLEKIIKVGNYNLLGVYRREDVSR